LSRSGTGGPGAGCHHDLAVSRGVGAGRADRQAVRALWFLSGTASCPSKTWSAHLGPGETRERCHRITRCQRIRFQDCMEPALRAHVNFVRPTRQGNFPCRTAASPTLHQTETFMRAVAAIAFTLAVLA